MAIYHLHVKSISRGQGKSVVAKAAYNAREKLRDGRDGALKDYSRHGDMTVFSGIFAPKDAPEWAHDRQQLWNEVEQHETHKKAQLAVEITGALPHEFTDQQREWLVKDFIREEFTRKGLVVDLHVHCPPRGPERDGDKPNHHFHALIPLREIGRDGFGERVLNSGSLKENTEYVKELREKWDHLLNRHLERHGFEERVDHRTLEAQGIDREPTTHRGPTVDAMERRGIETERGWQEPANGVQLKEGERLWMGRVIEAFPQPEPNEKPTVEQIIDLEQQWWRRIEQAVAHGSGAAWHDRVEQRAAERSEDYVERGSRAGWRGDGQEPLDLQRLDELRTEIVGMRREINTALKYDLDLAPEYRTALREIADDLRGIHRDTSKEIATLALELSDYEPKVIEMGRARIDEFAHTLEGAGREVGDLAAGLADAAAKLVDFFTDFLVAPSLPTREQVIRQIERQEEKQTDIAEARRYETDRAYREQVNEQQREQREREAREYYLKQNERERER